MLGALLPDLLDRHRRRSRSKCRRRPSRSRSLATRWTLTTMAREPNPVVDAKFCSTRAGRHTSSAAIYDGIYGDWRRSPAGSFCPLLGNPSHRLLPNPASEDADKAEAVAEQAEGVGRRPHSRRSPNTIHECRYGGNVVDHVRVPSPVYSHKRWPCESPRPFRPRRSLAKNYLLAAVPKPVLAKTPSPKKSLRRIKRCRSFHLARYSE